MHNEFQSKQISRRNIIGDVTGGRTDTGGGGGGSTTTTVNLAVYCMYVTLTNYDLNGTETVDGESPSNGDRILVANQTDAKQNGIYVYNSSGAWTRATDLVPALQITILGGTKQGTIWVVETPTFSIGTDNISIIESAISRKDESFSLGFTPVTSLMTSDIALFQVSSNEIQSATVQDIMDTYGARGLWDAVTVKTADTDVTGTTYVDVSDVSIDLDADSEYEVQFLCFCSNAVVSFSGNPVKWLYSGTYEDARFLSYNSIYNSERGSIGDVLQVDTIYETDPVLTEIKGVIKTTTSGTLKLQTAGFSGTHEVTIHSQSVFKVKKLDSFTNFQPSSGEANTGVNVGGEKEVYKSKSGTALQFRTLKEGTNVTLTQNTNDITIDVAGGGFYDGSVHLTSDASITGTTWTDAGLSISLDSASTYIVKLMLYQDTNSDTFNPFSRFQYSGTIDYSGYTYSGSTYPTVGITNQILGAWGVAKGNTITVDAMITTTTSGDLKVQHKGDTGKTAYLRKGSIMYYKKVV